MLGEIRMADIVAVGLNRKHPRWEHLRDFFADLLLDDLIFRSREAGAERGSIEEIEDLEEKLRRSPDDLWIAFDRSSRRPRGAVLATVEFEDDETPTLVVHAAADWRMWADPDVIAKAGEWCAPLLNELKVFARHEGCSSVVYRGHAGWAKHFPSRIVGDDGCGCRIH